MKSSAETLDKYAALVETLYRMTIEETLSWSVHDGKITSSFGDVSVELREGGDFGADIIVELVDFVGSVVDSFSDVTLEQIEPSIKEFGGYYSLMSEILYKANRQATGADKVLNSVLDRLGINLGAIPHRVRKKKENKSEPDDEIPF